MSVSMKISGLKNVEVELKKLFGMFPDDFRAQVKESGQTIATNAKKFVPVETSRLKTSIRAEKPTDNGMNREVTANTDYAASVEFGTSTQSAQPYLGPAFRLEQFRFEDKLIKRINKRL